MGPMTVEWGRDGPDLLVALDRDAGPLGVQIQDQLRTAIRDRRLAPGERLPSTRRMAELLGVSRGTVVEVYEQLLAEGYVESAVGSGTRVAAIPGGSALETAKPESEPDPEPPARGQRGEGVVVIAGEGRGGHSRVSSSS